ncbi:MAG: hypothetical protein HC830_10320 [Bacteroidetes bacterium]|nr:hypothetical protein [Bacteroidota bacterium]
MIRKILLSAIVSLTLVNLTAQESEEIPVLSSVVREKPFESKLEYNLTAGTSFITSRNFGSGSASYVAPEISYKLSPKIKINAGVMFLRSNVYINRYLSMPGESVVVKAKPSVSTMAYFSGNYLISDRLSMTGFLMKDLSNTGIYDKKYGPQGFQTMSLQMDYKLTDNITIGAGMHMSQGGYYGYPSTGFGFNSGYPGY